MKFIKVSGPDAGAQIVLKSLEQSLSSGVKVLWLLAGGSNISAEAAISKQLTNNLVANLSTILTDERFGPVDHANSNVKLLKDAGFDFSRIKIQPTLSNELKTLEETVYHYDQIIKESFKQADIIIGQFGMGPDGHIAGILPQSPAVRVKGKLATGYQALDFVRVSMTFDAIKKVDKAYLLAFGEAKKVPLANLMDKEVDVAEQPAQILRQIDETYVINDVIGESS
jgi:6-phosphogluconolactonase/glucosamine-6-phosphate isomerase/deaminase